MILCYEPNNGKGDIRYGTWNIKSLYRSGSFSTAARKIARYKSDLLDVQEVRWEERGTVRVGNYIFFY